MTANANSNGWQKLLLTVSSLAFCFAVLEIAVRIVDPDRVSDGAIDRPWNAAGNSAMHVRSANPRLVYELRPSARVHVEKFARTFRTNAAGFRDREFTREKPSGTYRIAAVGDSVTFGWDQPPEETYPKLLEQQFEIAEYTGVEVLNYGIGGYNTLQEVELIRTHVLGFEPDLIVLGYVMNDNAVQGSDGGLARHFNRTACRSCDFVKLRLKQLYRRFGVSPMEEALRTLGSLSSASDTPVVVVIFPLMELAEDGSYSAAADHSLVHSLASELGFPVLDLYEPFLAADFATVRRDPIHPNTAGHTLAAEHLFDFLISEASVIALPAPQPGQSAAAPASPVTGHPATP